MDSFLSYHAETWKRTHFAHTCTDSDEYSIVTITTNSNILNLTLSNISRVPFFAELEFIWSTIKFNG